MNKLDSIYGVTDVGPLKDAVYDRESSSFIFPKSQKDILVQDLKRRISNLESRIDNLENILVKIYNGDLLNGK